MMRFQPTELSGVWVLELERIVDERGWFARSFDGEEFREHGLNPNVVQCNLSFNALAGTLRGMHFQTEPHGESKLVRCVHGSIFDVVLDLRRGQDSFGRWHASELSAENGLSLYVPAGVAHGFQTLSDGCEVLYQMGDPYVGDSARGVRWDDPAFGIEWPEVVGPRTLSERDRSYPDFPA